MTPTCAALALILFGLPADAPAVEAVAEPAASIHAIDDAPGHVARKHGQVTEIKGPRLFDEPDAANRAMQFGPSGYVTIADDPAVRLRAGQSFTIEAIVRVDRTPAGTFSHIISKGRSHRDTDSMANQNYSFRLVKHKEGGLRLGFLWSDTTADSMTANAHRWTSTASVPTLGWHHVAISYAFGIGEGEPAVLRGYIDGKPTDGTWDMNGNSSAVPVVDDDDVWIGGAMGGAATATFPGGLDDIAIHHRRLTTTEIATRAARVDTSFPGDAIPLTDAAYRPNGGTVDVHVWEGIPTDDPQLLRLEEPATSFAWSSMAIERLPNKYGRRGVIEDRADASFVRMACWSDIPAGRREVLLRSLDKAMLYIDGQLVAQTPKQKYYGGNAHQKIYPETKSSDRLLSLPINHSDAIAEYDFDGKPKLIEVYRFLGRAGRTPRLGELVAATAAPEQPFEVITPVGTDRWVLLDQPWREFRQRSRNQLKERNDDARLAASQAERAYWNRRHDLARASLERTTDVASIDSVINASLSAKGLTTTPRLDDLAFLRRLTIDVTGRIPTPQEIDRYLSHDPAVRRDRAIDRLLASPEWADNWVGYWQDVLAENPGLTKPTLGNSGPFRWFLYDAFRANWGFDRFVSTLVLMEGSRLRGGPAGFAVATQNDAPMAAKAHVLGTAFLGVEMKCARCHDAPNHPFEQRDLFSMAAMLQRSPLKVPASSSVPGTPEQLANMVVKVTLEPGSTVPPAWAFNDIADDGALPSWVYRGRDDSRERLGILLTQPSNRRFAEVAVNRLWTRYLGRGLVNATDDWTDASTSHPELLTWLGEELTANGYDLKHVARLIFESDLYQRQPVPDVGPNSSAAADFRGPVRRRLSAEQLLDSAHVAVGKRLEAEDQTHSTDGTQRIATFLQFGRPVRAWEVVSASNERDRPSLSLPVVQSVNDLMMAYGWRQQRQDPLTVRENVTTPLQPMMLAYGAAGQNLADLTDQSRLVELAMQAESPDTLLNDLFARVLTRQPTVAERDLMLPLLSEGFDNRRTGKPASVLPIWRPLVSWRNHFDPKSDELMTQRMSEVDSGDPPTPRLTDQWRSNMEDVVWLLLNSPEFVWLP